MNSYSELMQKINQNTSARINASQFSFVRLIVKFNGDCTVEYGFNPGMVKVSQVMPYSMVSIISKELSLTQHTETSITTIGGIIIEYHLKVVAQTDFSLN